jgi:uncharacterized membrane protein YdjX (TVP38/TMEM64 family)
MTRKIIALIPLLLILVFILVFYFSGLYHLFTFETIQQEHLKWRSYVQLHPLLSALYFIGIYIVSVVLIIPDSIILTLIGGLLFPMPLAIAYVCISETIGGTMFFLSARLAISQAVGKKTGKLLSGMGRKLHEDQASYLLFLRFSHLLPFWVINLGAGIFRVIKIKTFIWTTLIGVLPLTYILVDEGANLSKYLETHTHFTLKSIFTTNLKVSLIALGCTALLPIVYKKLRPKKI